MTLAVARQGSESSHAMRIVLLIASHQTPARTIPKRFPDHGPFAHIPRLRVNCPLTAGTCPTEEREVECRDDCFG